VWQHIQEVVGLLVTVLLQIYLENRGVVVRERGGTPFRQIFLEPERRSGKYRWPQVER